MGSSDSATAVLRTDKTSTNSGVEKIKLVPLENDNRWDSSANVVAVLENQSFANARATVKGLVIAASLALKSIATQSVFGKRACVIVDVGVSRMESRIPRPIEINFFLTEVRVMQVSKRLTVFSAFSIVASEAPMHLEPIDEFPDDLRNFFLSFIRKRLDVFTTFAPAALPCFSSLERVELMPFPSFYA